MPLLIVFLSLFPGLHPSGEIEDELRRTQTDLQDAMDLCSQHEILIEERNHELNTLEAQVRYCMFAIVICI